MNAKNKNLTGREKRLATKTDAVSCASVGLDPALYAGALRYLFDRPVPVENDEEWFWNVDEPEFEATPLQWVHIQTVLFANAGTDLSSYSDEQVGMGLNYLMSNSLSNAPYMVHHPSVPLAEAMRMMKAKTALWRDCIGPRTGNLHKGIGSVNGQLGFVCYMWFDVWPSFFCAKHIPEWREAMWNLYREMLAMPWREVQVAALHGIGHEGVYLERPHQIKALIDGFVRDLQGDEELKNYAEAATVGMVQ